MSFDPEKITFFAHTDARGKQVKFGIKAKDRTRHVYVIGKTGMGKSTLLENMAVQDIQNGEGLAFIDPHGQTAETLLEYIPEERKQDVLYFAPFDTAHPVAFNVMEDVGPERRHLVVSGLMSVFKKIWVDAWSARMEYILQNTLMALLEYPDSTLLGVNRMLSDKHYRKKVVDNIKDPAVRSFWVDEFANYSERYMQEAGDAIKNKIGQFTANPLIRNIIGQPKSSFDLRQIMDQKKILIMNLSKGLVGESNANLLGSMLTTRIYLAAMSRADRSPQELKELSNFYFYVDEFQSFANATFADILSEARKYKLNLTIAHQYIEQMEEEVKNAVFGNVGTIISFRVGPFDAEVLETIYSPQFLAPDIVNLGFAQIYLTLMIDGIGSRPFSAVTLPPITPPEISYKEIAIAESRQHFAYPRAEVEGRINAWHDEDHAPPKPPRQQQGGGGAVEQRGSGKGNGSQKPRGPKDTSRAAPQQAADLRATLQQLAKTSAEKNPTQTAADQAPAKHVRQAQNPVSLKKVPSPEAARQKKPDVKQDLRSALAGVLKDQSGDVSLQSTPQPVKPPKTADSSVSHTAPVRPKESVRKVEEATQEVAPKPATERAAQRREEVVDPKVIARMLKLKTDDRSPLR